MALIIAEGFEGSGYEGSWSEIISGGNTLDEDYTYASAGVGKPIPGTTPGSQILRAISTGSAAPNAFATHSPGADKAVSYVRFYIYVNAADQGNGEGCRVAILDDGGVGSYAMAAYILNSGGTRYIRSYAWDGAWEYSNSVELSLNQWYRVEMKYDSSGGAWEFRVNGATEGSGDISSPRTPDRVYIGLIANEGTGPGITKVLIDLVEWRDDGFPGIDVELSEEGINIADSMSQVISYVRSYEEGVNISDTFSRITSYIREVSEGLRVSDVVGKSYSKILSEGIQVSDVFNRIISYVRNYAEGLNISDSVGKSYSMILVEGTKILDSVNKAYSLLLSEGVRIVETSINAVWNRLDPSGLWNWTTKTYDLLVGWAFNKISEKVSSWSDVSEKSNDYTEESEKSNTWTEVSEESNSWTETS